MVRRKIEDIRLREEEKLSKDLQRAFEEGLSGVGEEKKEEEEKKPEVVEVVEEPAPAPAPPPLPTPKKSRVILDTAYKILDDGKKIDFDSRLSFNLGAEMDLNDSFTLGARVDYLTLDFVDEGDRPRYSRYYSSFNDSSYEGGYSRWGVGLEGKLLFNPV